MLQKQQSSELNELQYREAIVSAMGLWGANVLDAMQYLASFRGLSKSLILINDMFSTTDICRQWDVTTAPVA